MKNNPWTYIVANCAIAVFGVLAGEQWPNIVGAASAPFVIAAIAALNAAAHAIANAGPASTQAKGNSK